MGLHGGRALDVAVPPKNRGPRHARVTGWKERPHGTNLGQGRVVVKML
jgi:hypothetical protein